MGGSFHERGEGFSSIIKKNNEKINKQSFFNWDSRSSIKTKTNRNYYVYEGIRLLHDTLLFTLKYFFSNFNYLFYGLCDSGVILKELERNSSFSVKSEILTRG